MAGILHVGLALQTPGANAPLWLGPPGMGKTSMLREFCALRGWHLETVISSIRDPSDFAGLPVPTEDGVRLEAPSWAKRLAALAKDAPQIVVRSFTDSSWIKGVLFLDEAGDCAPATQAALARVVLERVVGDLPLPPQIQVCAAANPPEEASSGWEHNPAFANRWVYLVSKLEDRPPSMFTKWLRTGESAVTKVPQVDPSRWEGEFQVTKELVAMFLDRHSAAAEEGPAAYRGRYPRAFATWRSWETAARLHATCRSVGMEHELLDLISGAVGEPMALQYATWVREIDLPDPKRLLLNPEEFTPDPKRPDRDYATMLAVVAVATEGITSRDTEVSREIRDRWFAAWKVIDRGMVAGKELVAGAAQGLGERRPRGGLTDPSVRSIIAKLAPVLSSAGVRAA